MNKIIKISDVWNTTREGEFYIATKIVILRTANRAIDLIITVKAKKIEEFNKLMIEIDHEKNLDEMIQGYHIGLEVISATFFIEDLLQIENEDHRLEKYSTRELEELFAERQNHKAKESSSLKILRKPLTYI